MQREDFIKVMHDVQCEMDTGNPDFMTVLVDRVLKILGKFKHPTSEESQFIGMMACLISPVANIQSGIAPNAVINILSTVFNIGYKLGQADSREELSFGEELAFNKFSKEELENNLRG